MSKKRFFIKYIGFLCVFFSLQTANAQSFLDPQTFALQNRKYHMKHEFNFAAAWLPIDAFEKGFGANFTYTYHFNDAFALELPQVMWISNQDTGLQSDLKLLFGLAASDRDSKNYVITSNIVIKPVYRKLLFFNKKVMYGEGYFLFGGGFFNYDSGFKPTGDIGMGMRLFLSEGISLKTEIRDYLIFDNLSPKNEPSIMIGLSFNRGGSSGSKR